MAYRKPKYTGPRYVPVEVENYSRNKFIIVQKYEDTQAIIEELAVKMGYAFEKSIVKMDSQRGVCGPDAVDWCKYVIDGILVIRLLGWEGYDDGLAEECDELFRGTTVAVFEVAKEPNDAGLHYVKLLHAFIDHITSLKSPEDITRAEYEALIAKEAEEEAAGEAPAPLVGEKRKFN